MFCETCHTLIQRQEIAAVQLHRAARKLARIAGKNQYALFIAAKRECAVYREECARNRSAFQAHRKTHASGPADVDFNNRRARNESASLQESL